MARRVGIASASIALAVVGCADPIEGEWVYQDAPDDLLLEASFVASSENPADGDVLFDIEHVPNVEMAVSWWQLDDGRYRLDFRCLDVPDRPDLGCDSLSFFVECSLAEDRLSCDFAGCAECGSMEFERAR